MCGRAGGPRQQRAPFHLSWGMCFAAAAATSSCPLWAGSGKHVPLQIQRQATAAALPLLGPAAARSSWHRAAAGAARFRLPASVFLCCARRPPSTTITTNTPTHPHPPTHTHPVLPTRTTLMQQFVKEDLDKIYFSNFRRLDINGVPCWLTRTG